MACTAAWPSLRSSWRRKGRAGKILSEREIKEEPAGSGLDGVADVLNGKSEKMGGHLGKFFCYDCRTSAPVFTALKLVVMLSRRSKKFYTCSTQVGNSNLLRQMDETNMRRAAVYVYIYVCRRELNAV